MNKDRRDMDLAPIAASQSHGIIRDYHLVKSGSYSSLEDIKSCLNMRLAMEIAIVDLQSLDQDINNR
ncbi:MAG: hypothetical protein LUQ47_06470 [Methanotrichaceae archaeon]|nr:hypothetical protein [Methanotrichaceae archaeon]